jgi:hypothetical protein
MDSLLDVRLATLEGESVERTLGLTLTTRLINFFDAGYVKESETGEARKNGYEIAIELPLFDWGRARIARTEAQHRQALARAKETEIEARSPVRERYAAYRAADVLPVNSANGTLVKSVFRRENGHEKAVHRGADHWLSPPGARRRAGEGTVS